MGKKYINLVFILTIVMYLLIFLGDKSKLGLDRHLLSMIRYSSVGGFPRGEI